MIQQLFFAYFSAAIVLLSILVITRRNPVHSVMWMLLLFFHLAGLYLFLGAEFIAAIQVIVYAGAILVLFLFVVLLLNLREELKTNRFITSWPVSLIISAGILLLIISSLRAFLLGPIGKYSVEYMRKETNTVVLGKILYTEFLLPFEIVSLVLLVAIIGAIVLAKRRVKSH